MDFSFTEEQQAYKNKVIDFAKTELNDSLVENDLNLTFSRKDWQKCADFGIQGLASENSNDSSHEGFDMIKATLAMEGLGYGTKDNGIAFALNAQMWTVQLPLLKFGNDFQKKKYLTKMVSGQFIGCHGLTEPNAGSDVFNMQTTAEKVEGGYILNGKKHLITLGPVADMALVFANARPKMGKWGITAFLVESNTKGFTQSINMPKMGLRTVPIGELEFKDCFVPEENRMGAEGAGFGITTATLEYDRCCILASQLGAMQRQLEETIAFTKERKQFGKSISEFQSVSNRIADMKLRLETSRLLLYQVAWLKGQNKSAMMEAALLKLQLSESFLASSIDAVRCNGGRGYLTENEVERDIRDAVGGILYAGTSDIQRNIISNLLGL